ncbi:uncharacterized protein LOC127873042 [Dreissena polymorpha]|uniref:RCC1-like domain-containing protein n=1 Tax=Dreissena polymorpha TaxID=45954 RepID=A0A9D4QX32_DREPO|nr:uncharacterized protein LOC127873042 [Dreissena polymorpha]KAH3845355.1 hypothetical protein DPMN_087635 [Dreissena polymorpha]
MSVYVWGFGKLGQLGNGQTEISHTPVEVKLRESCREVQCGGHYTAVVTDSGALYTFGCGKYGRLGTGDETDRRTPVRVRITKNGNEVAIHSVSCGNWHGAAISNEGELYTWGFNRSHGVLGSADVPHLSKPSLLPGPFTMKVAGVSCGNNFTLLWTTDGVPYSWGCGRHGVLGHGDELPRTNPTLICQFEADVSRVSFMSAGFSHCAAVTDKGVYTFGRGQGGALGHGQGHLETTCVPSLVKTLHRECKIVEVSCSVGEKHGHTLFLDADGHVLSCGDGYKGKLGFGDQISRFTATQIPQQHFSNEKIRHVAAGGIHSAAVSFVGHIFTWGCGSDGRLGHTDGKGHRYLFRSDTPRLVEALSERGVATAICSSYYHVATLIS